MISLITIHHNRELHLQHMLQGIAANSILPDEVVVVNMGRLPDIDIPHALNIIWVDVEVENEKQLPIGHSRNMGVEHATGDHLIFLDVDCIPEVNFIEILSHQIKKYGGLIMGQPKYLIQPLDNKKEPQALDDISVFHPQRPRINRLEEWGDPGMFWSLCFGISRKDFKAIGRFDEKYSGYGAEDTDLSFTCRDKEIKFYLSPAIVYHQQHGFFKPPINQLEAIIDNCNVFYSKWNHWCMGNHLQAFAELGLIDWKTDQNHPIKLLKNIDSFEMDQYYISHLPYA